MKRFPGVMLAVIAVSGGLALGAGVGQDEGNGGKGKGERGKLRGEFRQEIQAHFQQQRGENKEFREGLKGQEPAPAVAAMKTHRDEQYKENKTFLDAEYTKLVDAIKAKLAGKEGGDAKLAEILKKLEARRAERVQKMEARHTEIMTLLTQLSQKADLTWDDIHAALKDFHAKHAGEFKREGKGPGQGRGEGKGEGRGEGKGKGHGRGGQHPDEAANTHV
jgi:hypothetical protein